METEGARQRWGEWKRQREDRSWSWVIVTSIDPISCCLFAHSPLCIKGAVQAACRPPALHLITWHANRCYGPIRAHSPFPLHLRLPRHKGDGLGWWWWGREVRREGRRQRRKERKSNTSWWPCIKKKMDGRGECGGGERDELRKGRRKDGRDVLVCPVWSAKWPHCAAWPSAVCLCPNRLIPPAWLHHRH